MSDLIKVSTEIENKINNLKTLRHQLKEMSELKSKTIAEYEKQLAITLLKLRNNIIESFEELNCKDLPASVLEKTAKGMCWKELLEREKAENGYKGMITAMQSLQAELNGWQSILRYMEEK